MAKAKPQSEAGNTLAARLARLGIHSQAALLTHLPLRYEDETRITAIREVPKVPMGVPVQLEAEVIECTIQYRPRRQLLVRVRDGSGEATLRFLNFYPSQQKQMAVGARLRIFGEARASFADVDLIHPRVKVVDAEAPLPTAMTPVYPTTAGLAQSLLRKLIERALEHENLDDTLPEPLRKRYRLAPFADSLRALHHPLARNAARRAGGSLAPGLATHEVRRVAGPATLAAQGLRRASRPGCAGAGAAQRVDQRPADAACRFA